MFVRSTVGALVIAAFTLGAASAQDLQGKRVALLTNVLTSGWIAGYNATSIKIFNDNGVKVVNMVSPSDAALQSQQVDDAIAQKFDVILLHHINEVAIIPALERAKKAGIPVVLSVDNIAPGHDDLYQTLVGFDIPSNARSIADEMAKALSGKSGKVAIIQGIPTQTLVTTWVKVFKEELAAKAPKLEVAAVEGKSWRPDEAGTITRELSLRFAAQGGLQGIYAMNDFQAAQSVAALAATGAKPGQDVFVVSTGCAKVGIDAVRAGKMLATIDNGPMDQAKASADTVMKILRGNKDLPKVTIVPSEVVTKANVEQHAADCTY
jgi:ABC-type sugar transport system substrate-binding protein